jgi:hypothetical protein
VKRNSFNFEIEASSPLYATTRKHKKSKAGLFILLFSISIAGFITTQFLHFKPATQLKDTGEQVIKTIPLPNLEKKKRVEHHLRSEQEVQNLLGQKYIDPLTKYIEKHRRNEAKALYVQKVKTERDRRCVEIEKLYNTRKNNLATFTRLKKNYNYSCPHIVVNFANRLKPKSNRSAVSKPVTTVTAADFL